MNSKTVNLEEIGMNTREGRAMILNIINNQINNYKLQYLTAWEKNHRLATAEQDYKIGQLVNIKNELIAFFNTHDSSTKELSFNLNLEISLKDKANVNKEEESLVLS